jgi:CBS domain-containing protein
MNEIESMGTAYRDAPSSSGLFIGKGICMRKEQVQEEERIAEERAQPATRFEQQILQKRIDELPDVPPAVMVELGVSARDAIETMAQEQVDGVLVVQQGKLVGVCSTRDVVVHLAIGAVDIDHLRVDDCMQPPPICLHPSDELAYALNQMFVSDSQLIPLIDAHDCLTGLLSMRYLVRHLVSVFPQELLNLPPVPEQRIAPKPEGA